MKRQNLSPIQNSFAFDRRESAIAPPQPESAIGRSSTHPIEELQGAIGNRAVNQLLANQPVLQAKPMFKGLSGELVVQPKLTIGEIGDKYEQEADRVAEQIVSQINAPENLYMQPKQKPEEDEKLQMKPEIGGRIQRETMSPDDEDEDEQLRMKPVVATDGIAATPDLEASIQQARSSGQPLGENIRQPMEKAFGSDFSGVRVHIDSQSHQFNQSIQAKAFTTGQDIFFRQGEYQPGSQSG
ncbi:MAG: DUF4157 domain-containing protein [Microcoleus sp. SU_5_3]|nr:DUF4157 domain-containing protein [Microcoleus sp. SU_5_3]